MIERGLILMGGAPGSGTSRLSRSIERQLLRDQVPAEHISIGNRIRHIGAGVLHSAYIDAVVAHLNTQPHHEPIDDEIMYGLVGEALDQYGDRDVILLDGYPGYASQVHPIEQLAAKTERRLAGMLITTVDTELSLVRMIKRGKKDASRSLTIDEAISRLAEHTLTFPDVVTELRERGVQVMTLDTSGEKEATDHLGLAAVRYFLRRAD